MPLGAAVAHIIVGPCVLGGSTVVVLCSLLLIPPVVMGFCCMLSIDPETQIRSLIARRRPTYDVNDYLVFGHLASHVVSRITLYMMILPCIPLMITVIYMRRKVQKILRDSTLHLSKVTRHLQEQFLLVLSIQACLPAFYVLAVINYFCIGYSLYFNETTEYLVYQMSSLVLLLTIVISSSQANLLKEGITSQLALITNGTTRLLGFPQSALNGTEVEVRLMCSDDINFEFEQFYYERGDEIPSIYEYTNMVFYKSKPQRYNCKDAHGPIVYVEKNGGKLELKSVERLSSTSNIAHNVSVTVEWRQPHGYLSAIDYPLERFYLIMCIFYMILAFTWLYMCIKYYRDILKIQYWIGAVIILGMVEKAAFYSEYAAVNNTGSSVQGLIQVAELISCLKRTMSRVLIIIVSVGYGVVKPKLGQTFNQVASMGVVYFFFCAIEGLARSSKNPAEARKQMQFAELPLHICELVIIYWIFTSLGATTRQLRTKRNEVKLAVFRHFANTLGFAVVTSVIFMVWSLYMHVLTVCREDWKEIWIDTAFWHVLFCSILIVIMILWRPSNNNQQYAFTPLLDDSEDEETEIDELFNRSNIPVLEDAKQRNTEAIQENRRQKELASKDAKLQEDLKWIELHILPTTFTEQILLDEEGDREAQELEQSKML